jgi:hypothetical protein
LTPLAEANMRPDEFLDFLHQRPFVPLRIHLTDGKTFDIFHPDVVLVLRSRIDIGIGPDPTNQALDRVEHCSLLHVVRVEELPASGTPTTNGPAAST